MANVSRALDAWARDCDRDSDNLAILYLAGHGELVDDISGFTFLGEAPGLENKYEASINHGLVAHEMRRCSAADNVYIFDCCSAPPRSRDVLPVTGSGKKLWVLPWRRRTKTEHGGAPPLGQGSLHLGTTALWEPVPPQVKPTRETAVYICAARAGTSAISKKPFGPVLSRALLGDHSEYPDAIGPDALLRTAGELATKKYAITHSRLNEVLPAHTKELLTKLYGKSDVNGYAPSAKPGQRGPGVITFPMPAPQFSIVVTGLHCDGVPPKRVVVKNLGGDVVAEIPNGEPAKTEDEMPMRLEGGLYKVHVWRANAEYSESGDLEVVADGHVRVVL